MWTRRASSIPNRHAVEFGFIRAQLRPSAPAASMHCAALPAGARLEARVPSPGLVPAGFATSTGKWRSPVLQGEACAEQHFKRKRTLRLVVIATALIFLSGVAMAETINFDHESAG